MLQPGHTLTLDASSMTSAEADFINQKLSEFNLAFTQAENFIPLVLYVRSEAGEIVAGLIGVTFWTWLHVDTLWVSEALRSQGYGKLLMECAEKEAIDRGCLASQLETHDFQALPFYQKLGYSVFGELDNFPPGHKKYFLEKRFQQYNHP